MFDKPNFVVSNLNFSRQPTGRKKNLGKQALFSDAIPGLNSRLIQGTNARRELVPLMIASTGRTAQGRDCLRSNRRINLTGWHS